MVAIRINRIKVNRGGPLESDFHIEPRDVNLIYGHNETGKSYIVEAIINFLFRTGKKSTIDWQLRDWDFGGSITVSGLENKPVAFTRTSKKLDDYWEEEIGLPQDFSRLLVVKEGETLLADEEDGVGRRVLKNYLSGEGLIDRIKGRISATLSKATVQDRQIIGSRMGEIKDRDQLIGELEELDSLLTEAEEGYTSRAIYDLRKQQDAIETEQTNLEKAKRYYAACLLAKKEALNQEKESLPSEDELSSIVSDISVYEDNKSKTESKSEALRELESESDSYRWVQKALEVYQGITAEHPATSPKPAHMILSFIFLAGAIVSGFLNLNIPLFICIAVSLGFSVSYFIQARRALASAGASKELERLSREFKNRYGSELTDKALLEAQVEKLREGHFRATSIKKDLEEELIPNLKSREISIGRDLKRFTGKELPPQDWRPTISELKRKLNGINDEIISIDKELTSLAVSEEDLLNQDPGVAWDAKRYQVLEEESTEISQALDEELRKLEELRIRIAQETHLDTTDWEELVNTLSNLREKAAGYYKEVTAEILAKIQLNSVIKEFREEENARIASGLESKELTEPLHAITQRYKCIKHDDENGLLLITDQDEEYPLAEVSTGAREQAFLAMRLGFSSITMKGQTAFLFLDDAFQHSDWVRRPNLMEEILRIVKSGWQVFYFTMDDHIKDLFLKAGEELGDRFRSQELR